MSFDFRFKGGVVKPTEHTVEKFLLFIVVGGHELPMYQALRDGLVIRPDSMEPERYAMSGNVLKLFIAQQGFGVPKRFHSFYLRLVDDSAPMIKVMPFSVEKTGMYFLSSARFMDKQEVMTLLDASCESRSYVERQETLPLNLLRSMVLVDRSEQRKNVRMVRIGDKVQETN